MSQPTADSTDTRTERPLQAVWMGARRATHVALGTLALVPVGVTTLLRVLRNSPARVPAPVDALLPTVSTLAFVVPALALVALGATVDRRDARVALLAAGLFPLLPLASDAAWIPAAGALVGAGGASVALTLRERGFDAAHTAIGTLGVGALSASLLGSAGVATVPLQSVGTMLAFVTLTALPLARDLDTAGLVGWVVATLAVAWLVASAPFVAGAVTLVAFAAGDVPVVLLAAGVGGAVAVALSGLWNRQWGVAVGTLLLLAAGVPVTLTRGVAVVLGLVVLVATWDGSDDEASEASEPIADVTGGEPGDA